MSGLVHRKEKKTDCDVLAAATAVGIPEATSCSRLSSSERDDIMQIITLSYVST